MKTTILLLFSFFLFVQLQAQNKYNLKFSGIALPSKTPESGWAVQGGLVGLFKTDTADTNLRSSNLYLFGMYSQLKQFRISNGGEVFFKKEKYYLNYWIYYTYAPEQFFGSIPNTNYNKYDFIAKNLFYADVVFLRKIRKNTFFGFNVTAEKSFNFKTDTAGYFENAYPVNKFQNYNLLALGLKYQYDSRNSVVNTTKGNFVSLVAKPGFTSKGNYFQTRFDARKFIPYKKQVFAFQLFADKIFGFAPLGEMPNLNLRAFHPNLYKGTFSTYLQAEQRWCLKPWLYFSTFEGTGWVTLQNKSVWQSNYGGGFRVRVIKAYNLFLRVEYGLGSDGSSNLYLAFYDAF